jgi:hypothetical protein
LVGIFRRSCFFSPLSCISSFRVRRRFFARSCARWSYGFGSTRYVKRHRAHHALTRCRSILFPQRSASCHSIPRVGHGRDGRTVSSARGGRRFVVFRTSRDIARSFCGAGLSYHAMSLLAALMRTTSLHSGLPARVRLGGGILLLCGLPSRRAVRALAVVYAMSGWDAPALDFKSRAATASFSRVVGRRDGAGALASFRSIPAAHWRRRASSA